MIFSLQNWPICWKCFCEALPSSCPPKEIRAAGMFLSIDGCYRSGEQESQSQAFFIAGDTLPKNSGAAKRTASDLATFSLSSSIGFGKAPQKRSTLSKGMLSTVQTSISNMGRLSSLHFLSTLVASASCSTEPETAVTLNLIIELSNMGHTVNKCDQLRVCSCRTEGERLTGPKLAPSGMPSPRRTRVLMPEVLFLRLQWESERKVPMGLTQMKTKQYWSLVAMLLSAISWLLSKQYQYLSRLNWSTSKAFLFMSAVMLKAGWPLMLLQRVTLPVTVTTPLASTVTMYSLAASAILITKGSIWMGSQIRALYPFPRRTKALTWVFWVALFQVVLTRKVPTMFLQTVKKRQALGESMLASQRGLAPRRQYQYWVLRRLSTAGQTSKSVGKVLPVGVATGVLKLFAAAESASAKEVQRASKSRTDILFISNQQQN